MNSLYWDLNDIAEVINFESSPDSGYESPERAIYYIGDNGQNNSCESGPHLEIIEQPQEYFGFRYLTEYKKKKPYGPLTGINNSKSNKTFPTVRLNNHKGKAIIRCWLCDSNKKVHLHQLLTKNDQKIKYEPHDKIVTAENNIAIFEGLNIIHAKTKDEESLQLFHVKRCHAASGFHLINNSEINEAELLKEVETLEKNKVLLYFVAYDYETKEKLAEVYSHEIKNTRNANTKPPKIAKQSIFYGKVQGDNEVLIFVDKVPSDIKDIEILFFELDVFNKICWHAKATIEEIWHQYGIAFRTPPYRNLLITENKKVFFKIVRVSDNSSSNDMVFYYQPDPRVNVDYLEPILKPLGKKRRLNDDNEVLSSIQLSKTVRTFPSELNTYMEKSQNFCLPNASEDFVFVESKPQEQTLFASEELPQEIWPGTSNITVDNNIVFESSGGTDFSNRNFDLDLVYSQLVSDMSEYLPDHHYSLQTATNSDSELVTDSATNASDTDETVDPNRLLLVKKLFKLIIDDNNESNIDETLKEIKSFDIKLSDFSTAYEKTPLHIAIENKKFSYIKSLILAGVKVNALDGDHNSALHLAVYHNASVDIISFLLCKGADTSLFNCDGETAVHLACRLGRDKHLEFLIPYIKVGAIYRSTKTGDSPLHVAVKYGFITIVETLLKAHPVFSLNNAAFSPLDYAVKNKNEKLVRLLLTSLDPKEKKNIMLVTLALSRHQQKDKMNELLADYMSRVNQVLGLSDVSDETIICDALKKKCVLED